MQFFMASQGFGSGPPLLWGMPSAMELVVILLIVLVLFGNRLPSMARNIGRSFTEFKKGIRGEEGEEKALGRDEEQARIPSKPASPEKETTRS